MIDRRDPESRYEIEERRDRARAAFRAGGSEDVFRATLYGTGMRGREIGVEVSLNLPGGGA